MYIVTARSHPLFCVYIPILCPILDSCLHLALIISHELGRGASNGQLARLLDLGLEGDLGAVAPHLGHEGLAGDDGAGEADLDVLEGAEPREASQFTFTTRERGML